MDQPLDAQLDALVRERRFDACAALAFERYGAELHGFLVALLRDGGDAGEVFSQTVEDFWRGLPSFAGRCSVRTWLYVLARHAASRYRRAAWRRAPRTGEARLDELIADSRSRTAEWLRSSVKDRWQALRDALGADDQTLLILRVDRDLSWNDVARVFLGEGEADDAVLAREAARLRKRFQLVKEELRRRARSVGLIPEEE